MNLSLYFVFPKIRRTCPKIIRKLSVLKKLRVNLLDPRNPGELPYLDYAEGYFTVFSADDGGAAQAL